MTDAMKTDGGDELRKWIAEREWHDSTGACGRPCRIPPLLMPFPFYAPFVMNHLETSNISLN